MNKKRQYQILLLVLITIVIFNVAIMLTAEGNSSKNVYNVTTVGKNSNGTVYKIIAGDESSTLLMKRFTISLAQAETKI